MKSLVPILAAVAMAIGSGAALAHDDATLDKQKAPHGGQMRMAGAYHFELVLAKDATGAQDSPVVVYVTDHAGAQVPSAGATGSATLGLDAEQLRRIDGGVRQHGGVERCAHLHSLAVGRRARKPPV